QPVRIRSTTGGIEVKRLFALGVMLIALATAGPALADRGQSTASSAGTVQVGSATASPTASADAPVNVTLPVCIAGSCSSQAGSQDSGGASAAANGSSSSGSGQAGSPSADQSTGSIQLGPISVDPASAASAPVNANAPVCVLASCSSTSGGQQSAGASSSSGGQQSAGASSSTEGSGSSQSGGQSADPSLASTQVDSASVSPAGAVSAPVNANAPVCVLASCSSSSAGQQGGGASSSTGGSGTSQSGDQTTVGSPGSVQAGPASVDP